MKKELTHLLLSVAFALLGSSLKAQPSIVDSILKLHFEKVGGKEAWQSINSYVLTQSGYQISFSPRSITDYGQEEKIKEIPRTTYYQYPGNYRTEWFTDGQKDFIILTTARETKLYGLFGGADAGSGMVLPKQAHEELYDYLPFFTIGPTHFILLVMAEKELVYKGIVDAYGKDCHHIVLSGKSAKNKKINLYFDKETYLMHATSGEDSLQFYKIYTDYLQVDNIMIPHTNIGYKDGKLFERYKTLEIKFNQKLDEHIFLDK